MRTVRHIKAYDKNEDPVFRRSKKRFLIISSICFCVLLSLLSFIFSGYLTPVKVTEPVSNTGSLTTKFNEGLSTKISENISKLFYYGFVLFILSYLWWALLSSRVQRLKTSALILMPFLQISMTLGIQFLIYGFPGMPEVPTHLYYVLAASYLLSTVILTYTTYAYLFKQPD